MARYVDGFVVPVPQKKLDAYKKLARKACKIWLEYGALEYCECVADDVKPGKLTSFPQSVNLKKDETVVFAWITYKSRKDRDRIMAAIMNRRAAGMDPTACPSTRCACSMAASSLRESFSRLRRTVAGLDDLVIPCSKEIFQYRCFFVSHAFVERTGRRVLFARGGVGIHLRGA
jgi:uncharacterized protein YbaA (DUF1428 family)